MDENDTSTNPQESGQGLTRRQFLSYVLGGTGAFMGTLIAAPMVVSAFDPIHRSAGGSFSKTNWKPSQFNDQYPLHVTFSQHIDDAWNSQDKPNDVYVIKYQNKLMIMSHVCTHLGCHVEGSDQPQPKFMASDVGHDVWFFCPCHGSHYNKYGVNTPSSPAPRPLDLYHYKIESDGTVSVGSNFQRTDATWSVNPNPTVD
ncbi:ubiquinol-cytochrome c reductase iron-sulfur subunit [Alicyclobacillus mengziensis]|uniref:Ubiquinol-cytochrome c reductase iron-sulfur subunit n=1 Tax=Alicyclobacillus mengziensis TaxID=2931921 RepID=A0A9X7W4D8_9BACL|nr:ubiquinol-cytochrome c reductase iron-sulfur subunit [Alicyclobacillus mengziensis]QSO49493.1 ubiquinol-cytochrome c reductase iron-sulfur subunit [Alicyclobacillus mengziensis]